MSVAEIKAEMDRLSPEEVKQLSDYLSIRAKMLDKEFMAKMSRKIDDKNSANWFTLEEAEKRLFPDG